MSAPSSAGSADFQLAYSAHSKTKPLEPAQPSIRDVNEASCCGCQKVCGVALLIIAAASVVGAAYIFAAGSSLSNLTILGHTISVPIPAIYGTAAGLTVLAVASIYFGVKKLDGLDQGDKQALSVEAGEATAVAGDASTVVAGDTRTADWVRYTAGVAGVPDVAPPSVRPKVTSADLFQRLHDLRKEGEKAGNRSVQETLNRIHLYLDLVDLQLSSPADGSVGSGIAAGQPIEVIDAQVLLNQTNPLIQRLEDNFGFDEKVVLELKLRCIKLQAHLDVNLAGQQAGALKASLDRVGNFEPQYVVRLLCFAQSLREVSALPSVTQQGRSKVFLDLEGQVYEHIEGFLRSDRIMQLRGQGDSSGLTALIKTLRVDPYMRIMRIYVDDLIKRGQKDKAEGIQHAATILVKYIPVEHLSYCARLDLIQSYDAVKVVRAGQHMDSKDAETMTMLRFAKQGVAAALKDHYRAQYVVWQDTQRFYLDTIFQCPDRREDVGRQIDGWFRLIDEFIVQLVQIEGFLDKKSYQKVVYDSDEKLPTLEMMRVRIEESVVNPYVKARVLVKLAEVQASVDMIEGKKKTSREHSSDAQRINKAREAFSRVVHQPLVGSAIHDRDRIDRYQDLLAFADEEARNSATREDLMQDLEKAKEVVVQIQNPVEHVRGLLALAESQAGLLNAMDLARTSLKAAAKKIEEDLSGPSQAGDREFCLYALAQTQSMIFIDETYRKAVVSKTLGVGTPASLALPRTFGDREFVITRDFEYCRERSASGRVFAFIQAAKKTTNKEHVIRALGLAERVALAIANPWDREQACRQIARVYWDHGYDHEAVRAIDEMRQFSAQGLGNGLEPFQAGFAYMSLLQSQKAETA